MKRKPRLICTGVDLSLTSTGIVTIHTRSKAAVWASGLVKTKPEKAVKYDLQERIEQILHAVISHVLAYESDRVAIENHAMNAIHSDTRVHELNAVVKYELWRVGVRFEVVYPNTLKKLATGNGSASKEEMMAAAAAAGFAEGGTSDDLADAFWAARWVSVLG